MLCTLHKRKNYREGVGKGVKYLGDGGEGTVKYIYINKSASGLYYTEERRSPGNFFCGGGGARKRQHGTPLVCRVNKGN